MELCALDFLENRLFPMPGDDYLSHFTVGIPLIFLFFLGADLLGSIFVNVMLVFNYVNILFNYLATLDIVLIEVQALFVGVGQIIHRDVQKPN